MVSIIQMQTLVVVAELGSFAAAARDLGISPAAVSKQIINLEKELALEVMNRTTRTLELTEVGKAYCEQCKFILEEVDVARALVEQIKKEPSGDLKIMSSPFFAEQYIFPYLHEFLRQYPRINIDVELSERMPDLEKEPVDLLLGMSIPATENVIQKRLVNTRWCFCASPEYLGQNGVPKVLQDLVKHRYIVHRARDSSCLLAVSGQKDIKVKPYICVNDSKAMVNLALKDLGIIKAHYPLVRELLEQGKLVKVIPEYSESEIPLYLAY